MYKKASEIRLRVQTQVGLLSVEQLWDLSVQELDVLAVELEQQYKDSGKKSFLVKKSEKDRVLKLKFDIVVDILTTKVEEQEAQSTARATKEHNSKIIELITEKKDDELKGKSVKELEKLLK